MFQIQSESVEFQFCRYALGKVTKEVWRIRGREQGEKTVSYGEEVLSFAVFYLFSYFAFFDNTVRGPKM